MIFYRTPKKYILRFCGLADFEMMRDGSRVTCAPTPETPEQMTAHLYFNQVLPLIHNKRGKLAFHGSAVDIRGAAIGSPGRRRPWQINSRGGAGRRRLALLTDEGLALERRDKAYEVLPGHPSLGLRQDSQARASPKRCDDGDARSRYDEAALCRSREAAPLQ